MGQPPSVVRGSEGSAIYRQTVSSFARVKQPRAVVPRGLWWLRNPIRALVSLQRREDGSPCLGLHWVFACGIAIGVYAWRPPLWWVAAWIVFALSGAYLLQRGRRAFIVALVALLFSGALMVQVRGLEGAGKSSWTRFADGTDVRGPRH